MKSIDPFRSIDFEKSSEISLELAQFAPEGFTGCEVLVRSALGENYDQFFVIFYRGNLVTFLYLGVARLENGWAVIQAKFSSNFEEVYLLVK